MDRRTFLRNLVFGMAALPAAPLRALSVPSPLVLQQSPLAGFQYHAGPKVWDALAKGARLRLVREPDNPHDSRAVAVYAGGYKLGYLPRIENTAAAYMMDHGHALAARITGLRESLDPWERVGLEVMLEN